MSVRRLAEDKFQPEGFSFTRDNAALAKQWIAKYPEGREASAVIPLLMIAQEQQGWVTKAAIEEVAGMLDMPDIRVLEVATFYTQFMLQPVGTKAHVQVCGTTPCMLRGSEELMEVCRRKIHPEQFHTNKNGTLSWEEVECQGACVNAPMVMIFKDSYEDLTAERLAEIIDEFEAGRGDKVKTGPQVDRVLSAPEGGLTSLLSEVLAKEILTEDTGRVKSASTAAEKPKVPPAKAAKPKTRAPETDPTLKSPSKAKGPGKIKASKTSQTSKTKGAGPTLKLVQSAKEVKPRKASKTTVSGGNSTMKLAATASGRAKPSKSPAKSGKAVEVKTKAEAKPQKIKKPAKPDDLKLISGVGPKLEKTLNDLGIYKFEQIAKWKKPEVEWVDDHLKFSGRITRDEWIKQAKALAKGGEAEYVRVFGKKPK